MTPEVVGGFGKAAGEIDLRSSLLQHFAEIRFWKSEEEGFLLSLLLDSLATQMTFWVFAIKMFEFLTIQNSFIISFSSLCNPIWMQEQLFKLGKNFDFRALGAF